MAWPQDLPNGCRESPALSHSMQLANQLRGRGQARKPLDEDILLILQLRGAAASPSTILADAFRHWRTVRRTAAASCRTIPSPASQKTQSRDFFEFQTSAVVAQSKQALAAQAVQSEEQRAASKALDEECARLRKQLDEKNDSAVTMLGDLCEAEVKQSELKAQVERLEAEMAAQKAEEEARLRAAEEARLQEARLKAEAEERLKAADAARLRAEEESRLQAEEEARLKAAEEARLQEAKLKAEEEKRLKAADEARLRAEEESRLQAEEEARLKHAEEARLKAEEEERLKAAEEARLRAEEESRLQVEEEARLKAAEEARLQEARLKAEEEERLKAADEARLRAEEESRLQAEEEARIKAAEEARVQEARLKAEEEERLMAAEEARLRAEEESRLQAEEEDQFKDAEEVIVNAEEAERLKAAEEDRLRAEEECRLKDLRIRLRKSLDRCLVCEELPAAIRLVAPVATEAVTTHHVGQEMMENSPMPLHSGIDAPQVPNAFRPSSPDAGEFFDARSTCCTAITGALLTPRSADSETESAIRSSHPPQGVVCDPNEGQVAKPSSHSPSQALQSSAEVIIEIEADTHPEFEDQRDCTLQSHDAVDLVEPRAASDEVDCEEAEYVDCDSPKCSSQPDAAVPHLRRDPLESAAAAQDLPQEHPPTTAAEQSTIGSPQAATPHFGDVFSQAAADPNTTEEQMIQSALQAATPHVGDEAVALRDSPEKITPTTTKEQSIILTPPVEKLGQIPESPLDEAEMQEGKKVADIAASEDGHIRSDPPLPPPMNTGQTVADSIAECADEDNPEYSNDPDLADHAEAKVYVLGTTLRGYHMKGTAKLEVVDCSKFKCGEKIVLARETAVQEANEVVGLGSIILKTPTKFDHDDNTTIEIQECGAVARSSSLNVLASQQLGSAAANLTQSKATERASSSSRPCCGCCPCRKRNDGKTGKKAKSCDLNSQATAAQPPHAAVQQPPLQATTHKPSQQPSHSYERVVDTHLEPFDDTHNEP